jgi:hypothetical protein
VPKARPLRTQFQKSSCRRHQISIVGMDPMAAHCRKLIVTGIYQTYSYQKFVMSYWLAFVPKALNMLSILKCNNYVLAIGLFRAFPSNNFFLLDGIIPQKDLHLTRKVKLIINKKTAAELWDESIKKKIKHKLNQSIQYLILFN